ncbi:putative acetyltransferase EpsM [termite gut metagenome]|uniref:Putative acetyltransferase EpsM n=1 Tax=termite gut metagenome TaxID=433724 RepID=A0A5J4S4S7_9ZZZZ
MYGAGGHAKVILDILKSNHIAVLEIFDDNPDLTEFMGIPISHSEVLSPVIVSIGNNKIRKIIVDKLKGVEYSPAVFAHSVIKSNYATIEEGTVVMQGAIIQSSVKIGKHSIINTRASIDHDCVLQDYVHIAPGVILCGNVQIGEGSFIGAGTTIMQGIRVGKWSVIGAGSVVLKDIPDHVTAVGSPCKIIKQHI